MTTKTSCTLLRIIVYDINHLALVNYVKIGAPTLISYDVNKTVVTKLGSLDYECGEPCSAASQWERAAYNPKCCKRVLIG